jgi:DNA processing protein
MTLPAFDPDSRDLLQLTLARGVGPVRAARLVRAFGSARRVLDAPPGALVRVQGVGEATARAIAEARAAGTPAVERELEEARRLGVRLVPIGAPDYPPLLATIHDPPPILYVRGGLDPAGHDRFMVAIVGSRACTAYGIEQAERFASVLARSGLTVVSGGARGIDSAAHRGALRAHGRTVAVLGCGLAHAYPPENAELFDSIVHAGGSVISELPLATAPDSSNFPARNRLISGMSLGVLVIEAGRGSGALITARHAGEDQGREVMAVPGRVDSPASEGTLELLKGGEAALVTDPGDVIATLEGPARHQFLGTHEARYAGPGPAGAPGEAGQPASADHAARVLEAAREADTPDAIARCTGLSPAEVRAAITWLELQGRLERVQGRVVRRD